MGLLSNWDNTKGIKKGENQQLPPGGYIVKIIQAYQGESTNGKFIKVSFDIASGEYKGFYLNKFKNRFNDKEDWKGNFFMFFPKDEQDTYTLGILKGNIDAIENSNNNIKLIPTQDGNSFTKESIENLKGKLVGAVMYEKEWEYEGRTGFYTTVSHFEKVEDIKNENYKVPEKKLLKKENKQKDNSNMLEGFYELSDDDLPF